MSYKNPEDYREWRRLRRLRLAAETPKERAGREADLSAFREKVRTNRKLRASGRKPLSHWQRLMQRDPVGYMLRSVARRARQTGVEFTLTRSDVVIPEVCPYLGVQLSECGSKDVGRRPSLDRIDPRRGYVPGNVVVVSFRANTIKHNATAEELHKICFAMRLMGAP